MALRDASWYNHPNTHAPKAYHVISSPPYVAACDRRVLLDSYSESSLEATHIGQRCRRAACKNRWTMGEQDQPKGER